MDKNVLDRPDFKNVHDIVLKEVNLYARQLLAVSSSIEFYITNSWVNIHRRGHSAGSHSHNNSLISGVLYLKVTETSGDVVFHRDIHSLIRFLRHSISTWTHSISTTARAGATGRRQMTSACSRPS